MSGDAPPPPPPAPGLLGAAIQALPVAVMVFDADHRLAYANDKVWENLGVDPAMVARGTALADFARLMALRGTFGPGDPEAQAAEALALDRSRASRRILRSTDGIVREVNSFPLPGGGFATCVLDVTGLAGAVDQANARRRMLGGVIARMRTGISLYDPDRRLLLHNPAYDRMAGAPEGALTEGMDIARVLELLTGLGEFQSDPFHADRQLALDRGREHVIQRRRPDGSVVRFVSSPVEGGGFQIEGQDITPLVQAEADARRRAALLDGVLGALPHGVCVYGPDRRISSFNAAYARLMAGAAPVAVGDHRRDVLARRIAAGEYTPRELEEIRRQEEGSALASPQQRRRIRPNGTALDVRSAPLPDGGHVTVVTDITGLQRAEEEANRRAAILQAMLDNTRHGISLYDADARLVTSNRLVGPTTGLQQQALLPGRSLAEIVDQQIENGEISAEHAGFILGLDRSQPFRYTRTRPDGSVLEVASDPTPQGGFVITFSDITSLARAESEAKRRADILQTTLDYMRHGICLLDAAGRIVLANDLAARMAGLDPAEVRPGIRVQELAELQRSRGEFLADPAIDAILARPDRAWHEPQRYIRRRADGTVIEVATTPAPDGGWIRTFTDITPIARAEAEAKRRADIARGMMDNLRDGICLFDAEGRVVGANALAARMAGISPDLLQPGIPLAEILRAQAAAGEFGPSDQAGAFLARHLGRPVPAPDSYTRTRPDGSILEVTTDPMPQGGFIRTYRDVTEDRRIREELQRAKEAAEAASRAKSRFLATMSHELRTPLNAVIGFSEALLGPHDAAHARDFAQAINEAGRHLLSVIDNILDVARSQTGALDLQDADLDPAALAAEAAAAMRPAALEAGLSLVAELPPDLPMLRADARRLRQILQSLLSNAVKFTPAGGTVTLAARLRPEGLSIAVSDTGIGMNQADIPLALEPFTQLDASLARRFQGSGLGLYLARSLAESMGGALDIRSEPGRGTRVELLLPASRLLPAAATPPSETVEPS